MSHLVAPSVNAYILDGSKVLLGRRANTGWMDGFLCPPGGHIEKGETPRVAMIRELHEELGVSVRSADIEFLCIAARNTSPIEYTAYEFVIRDKSYSFHNTEPEKCSELVWADIHHLPKDIIEHFRVVIIKSLIEGQSYLEIGY